jgi:histidine ammonia-lyase
MEDHVSMAAFAAQKTALVMSRARRVVALELLCAGQALDFQGVERASGPVRDLHAQLRERMPFMDEDRPVHIAPLEELL